MGDSVMDDQLHLAQVDHARRVQEMREEDIRDVEAETAVRLNSLMARTRMNPVDHKSIRCEETPKMALVKKQIADLQAEYEKLREQEQRNQFAAFLRLFRQKFNRPIG